MYQKFSKNLETQELYANGRELATIMGLDRDTQGNKVTTYPESEKKLVATIDSPVLVSDPGAVMQQITDYTARETALLLISKPSKITEYEGTILHFDQSQYPTLRGPNQDTLFFCKWLQDTDMLDAKEILEVCAGTGFIGRHVQDTLEKAGKTDYHLTYNDINVDALQYYIHHNQWAGNGKTDFIQADARNVLAAKQYDLVLCNPPYIPRKGSIEDNAYEGLELAEYMLRNLETFLTPQGKLIINFSSLSNQIINPLFDEIKAQWRSIKVIGNGMEVPLKVFNILNNPAWLAELHANPWLIHKPYHHHPYRHQITMYEITKAK